MVDFFTNIYSFDLEKRSKYFRCLRLNSLIRYLVRVVANCYLPVHFGLFKNKGCGIDPAGDIIVSFTSFPERIDNVWLVVESMFRQSVKPRKVILWLSKDQFSGLSCLPKRLVDQCDRGLEINFCKGDLRSHKKYFYTLKNYPNSPFLIVDDDVIYPSNLIERLAFYYRRYPNVVSFNRGYKVALNSDQIAPYNEWEILRFETPPSADIMPTGVNGVLYPPGVLHSDVLKERVFSKFCKYADDIWLYAMVRYAGNLLVKTDEMRLFIPIINRGSPTLTAGNVIGKGNDVQLRDLDEFYRDSIGQDLFKLRGRS